MERPFGRNDNSMTPYKRALQMKRPFEKQGKTAGLTTKGRFISSALLEDTNLAIDS